MIESNFFRPTAWDKTVFGLPTFELTEYSAEAFQACEQTKGHFTIKLDPLINTQLLHKFGFYYCDSLIVPTCDLKKIRVHSHPDAHVSKKIDNEKALLICDTAFKYGRFHRDFNMSNNLSNMRYVQWLSQLLNKGQVYGLYWKNELAGFIAYQENNLELHAISKNFQGKGCAKYWWSQVCLELFENGWGTVNSSISATNLPALNLYASLGFSFKKAQDVYHRLVI